MANFKVLVRNFQRHSEGKEENPKLQRILVGGN